jgi:2-haloacid dehalogenase
MLLDADGTLFDYDRGEASALAAAFADFGLAYSEERRDVYRSINAAKWAALERGELTKAELQVSRFADLFAELGETGPDPAAFGVTYLDRLADSAPLTDGAREVVAALARDRTLAIVTNGIERVQRRRLDKSGLRPYIADMFVSEAVGWAKPAPEYFDHVLRRLGLEDRSAALVVGDSLTSDIQGGINSGLDTCYYNPGGGANVTGIVPTYEIRRLADLLTL